MGTHELELTWDLGNHPAAGSIRSESLNILKASFKELAEGHQPRFTSTDNGFIVKGTTTFSREIRAVARNLEAKLTHEERMEFRTLSNSFKTATGPQAGY